MMRAMIAADPFLLMWLTLALAGLAIIAYTHPRIPLELTSVVLVAALLILFHVAPLRDADGANTADAVSLLKGFGKLNLNDFKSNFGIAVALPRQLLRLNLAKRTDRSTDAWVVSARFRHEF